MDYKKPIDISQVNLARTAYNKQLKALNMLSAQDILKYMTPVLGVQNSQILSTVESGGISTKYTGTFVGDKKIGTVVERTLTVRAIVAEMADEPERYRKSYYADVAGGLWKDHPFEMWLLQYGINLASEELHDVIFQAVAAAGTDLIDSFDGVNKVIDVDIASGLISAANNNLYATGVMTDTDCGEKLLAMWRSAAPTLRRKGANMIISEDLGNIYDDWYRKEHDAPPFIDTAGTMSLDGSNGKCKLVRTSGQPEGSQRAILTRKQNFKYGIDKPSDMKDMKAFESGNPYLFTAAMKYVFGVQFESIHYSEFIVNDQSGSPDSGSGSGA